VLNALFSGAGLALSRFAHLHGEPILRELSAQWEWMESALRPEPGAIVAEVTYMHSGRSANAGLRPSLFRHEIELPGEKASAGADVIPLSDLTVRYDSARGRFALRSKSRRAPVVPVVNSGISPEGFVSFLLAVGRQGLQPVGYFPGFDAADVGRWPRFRCGDVVLFRARWCFAEGETPRPGPSPADFFERTARWRRRHGLPRHVFVHTAAEPKPFYVDLESPPFVDLLRRALPAALTVTEMLPGPDALWVADRQGRYAVEFLAHLQGGPGSIRMGAS
jgi:hypothetical protein